MKYITILETEGGECSNVGTITTENVEAKFKQAVESHFDARLVSFSLSPPEMKLGDCINSCPIDCTVILDIDGETSACRRLELSQTWLY